MSPYRRHVNQGLPLLMVKAICKKASPVDANGAHNSDTTRALVQSVYATREDTRVQRGLPYVRVVQLDGVQ
jgi:hypothetical protein